MKLLTLMIENFKKIKKLTFTPDGENAAIYGDNGAGKTTVYDAFLWLLFGKDSLNQANFEIKELDEKGEPAHNLNHSVKAELLLEDGTTVSVEKVYKEKWTKKKGSTRAEHTGHTTDHFIDGVPVSQKEYKAKIDSLIDEEQFKLITNPAYFSEILNWKDRRSIIMDVCGDVTDEEVIKANKKLSKLPAILGKRTLEEYRKIIASKRKHINEQLDHIPTRIDEVTRGLPDVEDLDEKTIQSEMQDLTGRYEQTKADIDALDAGDTSEIKKQIRDIEAKRDEFVRNYQNEKHKELQTVSESINKLRKELMEKESVMERTTEKIMTLEKRIAVREKDMAVLRDKWNQTKEKTFAHEDTCTCPTCGQDIPEETVAEARESALKAFNLQKAEYMKAVQQDGLQAKEEVKELREEIEQLRTENTPRVLKAVELEEKLDKLRAQEKSMEDSGVNIASLKEYKEFTQQIADLESQLEVQNETFLEKTEEKRKLLDSISDQIKEWQQKQNDLNQYKAASVRIEELEEQEQQLAKEFEELEEHLYLTEEFIRTKVMALEDKINSKFSITKFKMFEQQVNGGISETCVATHNGVPYDSNLNHGAKVNVGLDIIKTLSEHYGVQAPIFIDNKESVTKLIDMDCQLISLVVSEKDKQLRIETKEAHVKEAV